MSRTFRLNTLFRHDYGAFTIRTRREGDIFRHQNGRISNSVFEKRRQARLLRQANAKYTRDAAAGDPEGLALPVAKPTVLWNIW